MKITYNWLRRYVNFDYSAEDLVRHLNMLGLEVDSFRSEELSFQSVVVGLVTRRTSHPNADRLSLCEVDVGGESLAIVCGAPNVAAGQKVPVAKIGAVLPNGLQIKPTVIRGVESQGMICSESELGLSAQADGIMILQPALTPGMPFGEIAGHSDFLIDIDVTPNRPDCFGIFGIARDVSAATGTEFRKPSINLVEKSPRTVSKIAINIHDNDKCPRYTARYIENVKVGPSPLWLRRRLEQIGIRSINNVVDVTNFVMMETGQPLHAFDYDLIEGQEVHVRCARDGEQFTTLDNKIHKLNSDNLLICDKVKPVALAGVMGGLNSEVSAQTQKVLLESAYFEPRNIRRTSKRVGLSSESSKRFERGVDPNGVDFALNRAAQLIAELAGGELAEGIADAYPKKIDPLLVRLRPARIELLLGVPVPMESIRSILASLGFGVAGEHDLQVSVPTYRPDVTREADLIEEIGRIFGYDKIPAITEAVIEQAATVHQEQAVESALKQVLSAGGFSEVLTYDLVSRNTARLFAGETELVGVINPLSEDWSILRPSIIPSLLNAICWNINRGNKNLKLFERGFVFASAKNGRPAEDYRLAAVMTGVRQESNWRDRPVELDFFDAKGLVEVLLKRLGITARFETAQTAMFDKQAVALVSGKAELGHLGKLNSRVTKAFEIDQVVFAIDLDLKQMVSLAQKEVTFKPIPRYPAIIRDLAVVVPEKVAVQEIVDVILQSGGSLLQKCQLFDVFRGEQIGAGKKSVALNLSFLSPDTTLKESQVEKHMNRILDNLSKTLSAELRS